MEKYLQEVAHFLFSKHAEEISEYTLIFPNRRAGLFFQKYLSGFLSKPVFSPEILTISELIASFSDLKVIDSNAAIIKLWKTYSEVTKSSESLDDFFYWGEMLLSDFNDIDKYLVDAKVLFKNIGSLREIDSGFDYLTKEQVEFLSNFWRTIIEVKNSDGKEQFLNIWEKLYAIYEGFSTQLANRGEAYEGMMYKDMVRNIESKIQLWENRKIAFVGFNALNQCEKTLFDYFQNYLGACFFWDHDSYYMSNPSHEASLFMKQNIARYPMLPDFKFNNNSFTSLSEIELVSVPGFSSQSVYLSHWLNSNRVDFTDSFDNTAVVLCDESLLIPVLSSLPDKLGEFNITMGYPFKSSVVYSFLRAVIDVNRNSRPAEEGKTKHYYRNVLVLLNNPLVKPFLDEFLERFNEELLQQNKIYLTNDDFKSDKFVTGLFAVPSDASLVKDYLQQVISMVVQNIPDSEATNKEALFQLFLLVGKMHDSLFTDGEVPSKAMSVALFFQLLLRASERLSVPFEGEPLVGVQIMGFLETRCLDFDNLILLSFNDKNLPGNPFSHSFIPYALRKGFGLPSIEQRNAMYSYYFYRLLQRAKKVTMVYDSRTEGMSNGEVSRYITQLKYEAQHLKINEKQAVFNFETFRGKSICVHKTPSVMKKLETVFLTKKISPTLLNTYLDCNLKFYFRYIEGIKENEVLAEEIDQLMFGKVAHLAIEKLYAPFVGNEITKADIKKMADNKTLVKNELLSALQVLFFKNNKVSLNGKNILVFDLIEKYLHKILKYDQSIAPFTIISLEKEYYSPINTNYKGQPVEVYIGGIIDRLDFCNGEIRVVDYKTGKAKLELKDISEMFDTVKDRNKVAFQTLVYAMSVFNTTKSLHPVVPAVYGARSVFTENFEPRFSFGSNRLVFQDIGNEFELKLSGLIEEILREDANFEQVVDKQQCSYCTYHLLCDRETVDNEMGEEDV
jgi:CRISPR/Cas system-associated exonuclease Cas4 (RecB family)